MKLRTRAAITVMFTKVYEELNTFMSIMLMTKLTADMWMWDPFHNISGVI